MQSTSGNPTLTQLLADQDFSADWPACLPYVFSPHGRNALIAQLVEGQRVIHLGFADHGPLIEDKRAQGVWLHDVVMQRSQAALGVDINEQAVSLAKRLGVPNLHALDVHEPAMQDLVDKFAPTMWLLPDVLEHLHEPVAFLRRLSELAPQALLVISVPNALSLRNSINALRGVERINTDHLCWYSPFTTLKLLRRGGFEAQSLGSAQIAKPGSWAGRLMAALISWRPLWADNLVVLARTAR